jgi:hypothetical protein
MCRDDAVHKDDAMAEIDNHGRHIRTHTIEEGAKRNFSRFAKKRSSTTCVTTQKEGKGNVSSYKQSNQVDVAYRALKVDTSIPRGQIIIGVVTPWSVISLPTRVVGG